MQKKKSAKCRICGRGFIPAWNHPEQTVCYSESCRKKAAAERAARYAKKRKSTKYGRQEYSARERERYLRGKAGLGKKKVHVSNQPPTLKSLYGEFIHLRNAFNGLLKLLNTHFDQDFSYEECRSIGEDNIPDNMYQSLPDTSG